MKVNFAHLAYQMGQWKWILPQFTYVATHKSNDDDNVEKVYVVVEEEDIMVEQEAPWSPRPSTGTRLIWASDETEGNLHDFVDCEFSLGLREGRTFMIFLCSAGPRQELGWSGLLMRQRGTCMICDFHDLWIVIRWRTGENFHDLQMSWERSL